MQIDLHNVFGLVVIERGEDARQKLLAGRRGHLGRNGGPAGGGLSHRGGVSGQDPILLLARLICPAPAGDKVAFAGRNLNDLSRRRG